MNVGHYIFAQITDFILRYVFDKAYIDLKQMWRMQLAGAFFVMRPKDNMRFEVTREFTDDRLNILCLCRLCGTLYRIPI